ncbi:hypothetical protein J3459_009636 [Metarhizium acridum]|nr:hypothetical protein J3459_009636 [Metarhizium acridum]
MTWFANSLGPCYLFTNRPMYTQIGDAARSLTTPALLPRHTNMRIAGTAANAQLNQQSERKDPYGGICLVVIAVGVGASVVVLIAASVALFCSRQGLGCKRCTANVLSAVEEQKWPKSTVVYEAYPPWLLSIPKQPEQPQVPVLQREQSWASTSTMANNQNDAVSPMDPQTWDGVQHTCQVSPTTTYMSPVGYPTMQGHQGAPQWQPPAELPTTPDPGNTPLPSYPATMADAHLPPRFSWTGEEEASYRPSSWMKR